MSSFLGPRRMPASRGVLAECGAGVGRWGVCARGITECGGGWRGR